MVVYLLFHYFFSQYISSHNYLIEYFFNKYVNITGPVDDIDSTESHDFEYVQPGVQQFPKDDIDNKLQCSLDNVASELPVMWYKDGIPITTKVTRSSSSLPTLADKGISDPAFYMC